MCSVRQDQGASGGFYKSTQSEYNSFSNEPPQATGGARAILQDLRSFYVHWFLWFY